MKQKKSRNRSEEGSRYHPTKPRRAHFLEAFREVREELTGPNLQLRGGHILDIEGCAAVLACDGDLVRLRTAGSVITVLGKGLETSDFSASTLTVRGEIRSVELEPARRNAKGGRG